MTRGQNSEFHRLAKAQRHYRQATHGNSDECRWSPGFLWEWKCKFFFHVGTGTGMIFRGMGRNGNVVVPKISRLLVLVHVSYFVATRTPVNLFVQVSDSLSASYLFNYRR